MVAAIAWPWSRRRFWSEAINNSQNDESGARVTTQGLAPFAASTAGANAKAAALLLAQMQLLFGETDTNTKAIETKANTILGFLGGGLSLTAVFAGFHAPDTRLGAPLEVLAAVLTFGASMVFSIRSQAPIQRRNIPEAVRIRNSIEDGTLNETATTAYLVRVWQARQARMRVINVKKAQLMEITQQLFLVGTACAVLSFLYATLWPPYADPKSSSIRCVIDAKIKTVQAGKLICTLTGAR